MRMIVTKQEVLGAGVDLKEFFEASIGALQEEKKGLKADDRAKRRNRPLVRRPNTDSSSVQRAVTDAARALTAMWRPQPQRG
jgi:hypothetical protein